MVEEPGIHTTNQINDNGLNISDISFNETQSAINQSQDDTKQQESDNLNKSEGSGVSSSMLDQSTKIKTLTSESNLRKISTNKFGAIGNANTDPKNAIKKKNDMATVFKTQTVNGELDLSNKSKYRSAFYNPLICRHE